MSIFTIKRHLLFVRIACCLFIWYNFQAFWNRGLSDYDQPKSSLGIGPLADIIWHIEIYISTHLLVLVVISLFNIAGIISAIRAMLLKEWGRKWMITLLYTTIIILAMQFISELTMVCRFLSKVDRPVDFGSILLYIFMYYQPVLNIPISVPILFWIIKQFKSPPIKTLFQKKCVPETP